jgi:hypothetical protein
LNTKNEAAHEVRKVLQDVKDYRSTPGAYKLTEADTRAHFLDPLLRALGYHSIGDIQHEVFVPNSQTYLDYRLVVEGSPRVAVEAKAVDVALTDKHGAQVVQYCSVLGDEWGVVTNGREWRLYHSFAKGGLVEKLVSSVDMIAWETDDQFDSTFEQLWLVSKESFLTSDGPASWLNTKAIDRLLRDSLGDPSSPEIKFLKKRLQDKGVIVTAEKVATWLKTRLDASQPAPTPGPHAPPSAPAANPAVDKEADASHYWLIPAGQRHGMSAADHLKVWLDRGFWGFGESTPGRKRLRVGDWVCFYAAKQAEVLAYARMAGLADVLLTAEEWPESSPMDDRIYKVPLEAITWVPTPVKLDAATRGSLDAYAGRDAKAFTWGFFVQTTRRLTHADFERLTGRA